MSVLKQQRIVANLERLGYTHRYSTHGAMIFSPKGDFVAVIPRKFGEPRAIRNLRASLRRAGIDPGVLE